MDQRQKRGLAMLQTHSKAIRKIVSNRYAVPSQQGGNAGYVVDAVARTCTCEDFSNRKKPCKHVHCVRWLCGLDPIPEQEGEGYKPKTGPNPYRPAPTNAIERREVKSMARYILRGLCDGIVEPEYKGTGRPAHRLSDIVYVAAMKVFTCQSWDGCMSDLRDCQRLGLIERIPAPNTVSRGMENPAMIALLRALIQDAAEPLLVFEDDGVYAVDATGFATSIYGNWFDETHCGQRRRSKYLKAHCLAGTKTKVVANVIPSDGNEHEAPLFKALISARPESCVIQKLLGDKGYMGEEIVDAIVDIGAVPYIPFKRNQGVARGTAALQAMFHHFHAEYDRFVAVYGRRAAVENVFHSVKARFGEKLRAKNNHAQRAEIMLKFLAHNVVCLGKAFHRFGVLPRFTEALGIGSPSHDGDQQIAVGE